MRLKPAWGEKYPNSVHSWRRNWERVIPFFDVPSDMWRIIYATNAIERLNSSVRKAVPHRGHFPNDAAATTLIDLALRQVEDKWAGTPIAWHDAKRQFAIKFGERFTMGD